jgi:hypothetical protein
MHLRLQTWFPLQLHVCLNGREWLARQMTAEGLGFTQAGNRFTQLADPPRAQALLDAQLRVNWAGLLDPQVTHPTHQLIQAIVQVEYYWTIAGSEHATDVLFRDRPSLQRIYPALEHHGIMSFGAEQVLGFLGRKQPGRSEVKTDRHRREPGVRIKHWVDKNSLKLYDKGPVLRSEVAINEPAGFKVYRASESDPRGKKAGELFGAAWPYQARRAEVSRAANERHLEALAAVGHEAHTLRTDLPSDHPGRPAVSRAARVWRARIRPCCGLSIASGLPCTAPRHADLRAGLAEVLPASLTDQRIAGRISRLLRAHGLLASWKLGRKRSWRGIWWCWKPAATALKAARGCSAAGCPAWWLESQRAGQIRKTYCANDRSDAAKLARIYLSGLAGVRRGCCKMSL